jgi:uncharacterized membrane protein YidH (DUF202 family)
MMSLNGGFALLVIGAALTFALTGSVRGINLHTVGVILMIAGAAILLLALLAYTRRRSTRGR